MVRIGDKMMIICGSERHEAEVERISVHIRCRLPAKFLGEWKLTRDLADILPVGQLDPACCRPTDPGTVPAPLHPYIPKPKEWVYAIVDGTRVCGCTRKVDNPPAGNSALIDYLDDFGDMRSRWCDYRVIEPLPVIRVARMPPEHEIETNTGEEKS